MLGTDKNMLACVQYYRPGGMGGGEGGVGGGGGQGRGGRRCLTEARSMMP